MFTRVENLLACCEAAPDDFAAQRLDRGWNEGRRRKGRDDAEARAAPLPRGVHARRPAVRQRGRPDK